MVLLVVVVAVAVVVAVVVVEQVVAEEELCHRDRCSWAVAAAEAVADQDIHPVAADHNKDH